jgi:hypothetical protein
MDYHDMAESIRRFERAQAARRRRLITRTFALSCVATLVLARVAEAFFF